MTLHCQVRQFCTMYLHVPIGDRMELSEKIVELKKSIRKNTLHDKISKADFNSASEDLFKPIIHATEINTNLLKSIVPTEDNTTQLISMNAKDPIFRSKNGETFFGDQMITITPENIIVKGTKFNNTPGLLNLISLINPTKYTSDDVEAYKQFLLTTKWVYTKTGSYKSISKRSGIGKKIIQKDFIDQLRHEQIGEGLQNNVNKIFLPGNIKDALKRLNLLLGEFLAGNYSTSDELTYILDYLRSKKKISVTKYNRINSILYRRLQKDHVS